MPETIADKKIFTLAEVSNSIERTLSARYEKSFWVKAEIIKLNHYPHSGHCYPDLAEKEQNRIVAQMRATLWKMDFFRINNQFKKITGEPLKSGIQVLLEAKIVFDAVHGITLHILNIDPSFSLGLMEKEKLDTIIRLKEENIFGQNKLVALPMLPQRIAVVSVETSKGYADFVNILQANAAGYKFGWMLFASILQGDGAVKGIITQLNRIRKVRHHFDVVVIVRGGGGDVGLACYNHFDLAKVIASFPLPVLTGIGHATNETVAEMVANMNAITPTELANFLINKIDAFARPVDNMRRQLGARVNSRMRQEHQNIEHIAKMLSQVSLHRLQRSKWTIEQTAQILKQHLALNIGRGKNSMEQIENAIRLCSPENVLRRGYSIVIKNNKTIDSIDNTAVGDQLTILLRDGQLETEVVSIKNKETHE